jgi:defect-in-organelle-trafficking protein DotB
MPGPTTVCGGVAEPRRSAPGLDSLLTWAFQEKASRIAFQTGHPVWVSIHGRNYRVTRGASTSTN